VGFFAFAREIPPLRLVNAQNPLRFLRGKIAAVANKGCYIWLGMFDHKGRYGAIQRRFKLPQNPIFTDMRLSENAGAVNLAWLKINRYHQHNLKERHPSDQRTPYRRTCANHCAACRTL